MGNFTLKEAKEFIQKALGEDKLDDDSVSELAKILNHSPFALEQATAYINQTKLSIRQYLEGYKVTQQSKPNSLEVQSANKEFFKPLKINIDEIKKEEGNIGKLVYVILVFMAYLDSNQIDIEKIFLQKELEKDKREVLDGLDLLNRFSLIGLEKGIAKIHQEVQKMIRLEQRKERREEEVLRKMMVLLMDNGRKDISHIVPVWNYASEYNKLVNEFIGSDYNGSNILHLLAKCGNEKVIKLILEKVDQNELSKIVNASDKMDPLL